MVQIFHFVCPNLYQKFKWFSSLKSNCKTIINSSGTNLFGNGANRLGQWRKFSILGMIIFILQSSCLFWPVIFIPLQLTPQTIKRLQRRKWVFCIWCHKMLNIVSNQLAQLWDLTSIIHYPYPWRCRGTQIYEFNLSRNGPVLVWPSPCMDNNSSWTIKHAG